MSSAGRSAARRSPRGGRNAVARRAPGRPAWLGPEHPDDPRGFRCERHRDLPCAVIVAAQGATTPLPALTPDALPVLPAPPPLMPLQMVCGCGGAVVPTGCAGCAIGLHGRPGGTLTGEGIGMVTLGPELPARRLQSEPFHVQVWSYQPATRDVTPATPKRTP